MEHLTIQQIARHYADLVIAHDNIEALSIVREHGKRLIRGQKSSYMDSAEFRDALGLMLDPQYSVTRIRLDKSEKAMLENAIAFRVWDLTCCKEWDGLNR